MPVKEDYAYKAALRFVNKVRKKIGKRPISKLKKGDPNLPLYCAISNSIFDPKDRGDGKYVSTGTYGCLVHYKGEEYKMPIPRDVGRFIRKFDHLKYPGLTFGFRKLVKTRDDAIAKRKELAAERERIRKQRERDRVTDERNYAAKVEANAKAAIEKGSK